MNSRILVSLLTMALAVTVVTGGAYALFSAQATNSGNTFGAGTLTLEINPGATPSPAPVFNVGGKAPGESEDGLFKLHNGGTIAASSVQVAAIDTSATTGTNTDVLGHITLQFFFDINGDGNYVPGDGDTLIAGSGKLNDPTWAGWTIPGVSVPAGGDYNLGAILTLDADTPNNSQGDTATFSITFQANQ